MTRSAPLLALLVVAALANADPDQQRRTPAGLTPFSVALPSGTFGQWTPNQFQIANSGAAHQVPPGTGPWEVDVLECEVLSSYWGALRGDVTYLGSTTSPLNPVPTADKYEINGYIYPRDGQPAANGEAWQCYNDAASYWTKPYMAKARQTFVLPRGVTRFTANNHPFESSAVWNLVRFRSAPENCISSAGNFFIPKDGTTTAANAGKVCSDLGGSLADVTFKNIAEINRLARGCQGGNKKFHVAGWNGYDYGLGSMVFTSSSTSDGTGAVTIPDGGSYLPVCDRVKEKLTRRTSGNDVVLFTSGELMDYTQGKALCNAENRDLLNLNAPAASLTEAQKKATAWYRARALLFTTVGRFSSAYVGGFNGDPFTGSCIAFFNGGNSATEIGAISVPPGGCEGSKTNGVFCGPVRAGEPVRRSEL